MAWPELAGSGRETDAFAGSNGAESFGDDVGVVEGARGAGSVVADEVGTHAPARAAAGRLPVDDAPEALTAGLGSRLPLRHVARGAHARSWAHRKPTALLAPRRR
jgi:hypothetical protein